MKLIIAGSRDLGIPSAIIEHYILQSGIVVTEVVSGGCRGVDKSGEAWAKERNIPVTVFNPDWSLGKKAGPLRNKQMAKYGDVLLAFYTNESVGTVNMIKEMKVLNKPVYRVKIGDDK